MISGEMKSGGSRGWHPVRQGPSVLPLLAVTILVPFLATPHAQTLTVESETTASASCSALREATVVVGAGGLNSRGDRASRKLAPYPLCMADLPAAFTEILARDRQKPGWVVQIGAHVGFEYNDPIATPMLGVFGRVLAAAKAGGSGVRHVGSWMMVEAAPTNFKLLKENLMEIGREHSHIRFLPVNAGILATPGNSTDGGAERVMTFHSISSDVNATTGLDSRTGKTIKSWITQIGSFDRDKFLATGAEHFAKKGLDIADYHVQTAVPTMSVPTLLKRHGIPAGRVPIVLIDTEGFDCDIVQAMELATGAGGLRPQLIVFEHKNCIAKLEATIAHLHRAGYQTIEDHENVFATTRHFESCQTAAERPRLHGGNYRCMDSSGSCLNPTCPGAGIKSMNRSVPGPGSSEWTAP